MRIRKNLKLLNLSPYPLDAIDDTQKAAATTPTLCQLNQSPWDVLQFDSPNSSSYSQLEEDEFNLYGGFKIGGSIADKQSEGQPGSGGWINSSIAVKERDAAPNLLMNLDNRCYDDAVKKKKKCDRDRDGDGDGSDDVGMYVQAKKDEDGNAAREQCRPKNKDSEKAPLSPPPSGNNSNGAAKRRTRGPNKKASTSPYDYYYYSGFGPLWGKKRGEERNNNRGNIREKSVSEDGEIREIAETERFVDDNDEDGEEEGSGKKRARKPMKARSLKSFM